MYWISGEERKIFQTLDHLILRYNDHSVSILNLNIYAASGGFASTPHLLVQVISDVNVQLINESLRMIPQFYLSIKQKSIIMQLEMHKIL
jgi:hypothetical protein